VAQDVGGRRARARPRLVAAHVGERDRRGARAQLREGPDAGLDEVEVLQRGRRARRAARRIPRVDGALRDEAVGDDDDVVGGAGGGAGAGAGMGRGRGMCARRRTCGGRWGRWIRGRRGRL
jgi:hypothetical protein